MRRQTKKKVKKKTATKPRPPKPDESAEFDAWADEQAEKHRGGCRTCQQPGVRATIQALLQSLIRKRVYKFAIHDMLVLVQKKHPDADIGQRGLERHLRHCDRTLYLRARGRRNG